MAKPVCLSVHKNTRMKRMERERGLALLDRAKAATRLDGGLGGFALIAYPSVYGVTGIKTFMVSHDGVVYEKDLGPDTVTAAAAIEKFNPDRSWSPVQDDEGDDAN